MHRPSLHANFFSSLKQVEKRLKLDAPYQPSHSLPVSPLPSSQAPPDSHDSTGSLGSPIYINYPELADSSTPGCSETPRDFLTNSEHFPQNREEPSQLIHKNKSLPHAEIIPDQGDEIEQLMQLLWLSDCEGERIEEDQCHTDSSTYSCFCDGGFYEKIASVKGPKCPKEVKRLEDWIGYFSSGGDSGIEPLRLAHLLLGKAAFAHGGCNCCEFLEFPSTVEEFLRVDPP